MADPFSDGYQSRSAAHAAAGLDPNSSDDTPLGAFVFCWAHHRPHSTGWCTVHLADKTPLSATTIDDAIAETRALGYWIYGDPKPCAACGTELKLVGMQWKAADGSTACPAKPKNAYEQFHAPTQG